MTGNGKHTTHKTERHAVRSPFFYVLGTKTNLSKTNGATKSKQPRIELRINTPKTVHLPNFDLSYDQRISKM